MTNPLKILIASVALLIPFAAQAGPLTVVNVNAPAVNCVFAAACAVTAEDALGAFTLPGDSGTGQLKSRTFRGIAGSAAWGKYGYDYRIDMTAMRGVRAANCIRALKLEFGPVLSFAYKPGTQAQVYVVTAGGVGSVGPTSAAIAGSVVTFTFATPVCPGQTSYFFGLASDGAAAPGPAQMIPTPATMPVTVDARVPHP